jgi:hypothetical protein
MKICFFTIAENKFTSHVANTLAFTFKKNTPYTLQVFTKNPEIINFGTAQDLGEFNPKSLTVKFEYFERIASLVDADYYLYIDPSTYIVKSFNYFESLVEKDQMFALLDNELAFNTRNTNNKTWHGKKLTTLNILFNEFSKKNIMYHNVSSHFFGFKKDVIKEMVSKVYEIHSFLDKKISNISEEFILSILTGEYIKNINIHLSRNNFIYYGQDNDNYFLNKIPQNKIWPYKNSITNEIQNINSAIINCYNNKYILSGFCKEILLQTVPIEMNNQKRFDINFIIPCSRPYNLPLIIKSIEEQMTSDISYKIWVVFDFERNSLDKEIINFCSLKNNVKILFKKSEYKDKNNEDCAKNIVIDLINDGWIYQINDQNLLYPKFLEKIIGYINENPEKECLIFHQENKHKPQDINDIKYGMFDAGMYLINKKFINNEKIPEFQGGDALFIEKLYNNNPVKFLIINEILCFYNKFIEIE